MIIGVHTPETAPERIPANVAQHVKSEGITYPVLLDGSYANWNRWHQRFWPAVYLIDKRGHIRYRWEGELEYGGAGGTAKLSRLIERLLSEPG